MLFGQDMATRDPREGSPGPLHDAQSWVDKTAKFRVFFRHFFSRGATGCGVEADKLDLYVSEFLVWRDLEKSARTPQRYHRR